jgi:uncharacterized membrane protein
MLDETARTGTATGVGLVAVVLLAIVMPGLDSLWLNQLFYWDVFAAVWLACTVLAFRRCTPEQLDAWVRREDRRSHGWRRLMTGRSANSGVWLVAIGGVYAILAAAFVLPRAEELSRRWSELLVATGVLAVVLAWLTSQAAYTLHYIRIDRRHPGGLSFPGDGARPGGVAYAYFAVSVGTTFGTTDVDVLSSRVRRTVLLQNVYSFAFNTAVLAVAISTLVA